MSDVNLVNLVIDAGQHRSSGLNARMDVHLIGRMLEFRVGRAGPWVSLARGAGSGRTAARAGIPAGGSDSTSTCRTAVLGQVCADTELT